MSFKDILKSQKQGVESLASVGVIGMHMVSGTIVGVAIGYFLDNWLETGHVFKIIFLVVGILAGLLNVFVDTRALVKKLDKDAESIPNNSGLTKTEGEKKDGKV